MNAIDPWLVENLVCPRCHNRLRYAENNLVCGVGHIYPIYDGIPVLLLDDVQQTAWWATASLQQAKSPIDKPISENQELEEVIDRHVQKIVASTCGIMYRPLIGKLKEYPIPELRLPNANGELFLDIGCNWGRWCIAAAKKGYKPIGIDPSLEGVVAARRVCQQMNIPALFVVADARYLPFEDGTFHTIFSYSVLQHFSKNDAKAALAEMRRALKNDGTAFVQMPNKLGIRCLYHQAKRGFREAKEFEVRYWSPSELKETFERTIGKSTESVDGFFGLGIQPSDARMLPIQYRFVIACSEMLRHWSLRIPALIQLADSLYIESHPQK